MGLGVDSQDIKAVVDALHGITAQLEDLRLEMNHTRRALETMAAYMPALNEHLSSIACQMPEPPNGE